MYEFYRSTLQSLLGDQNDRKILHIKGFVLKQTASIFPHAFWTVWHIFRVEVQFYN